MSTTTCPKCHGTGGWETGPHSEECRACDGTGKVRTPPDRPSPASDEQVARQYRCQAAGPHHYGDKCDGGRVQAPNAQFRQRCPACAGTGLDAKALAAALAAEREEVKRLRAEVERLNDELQEALDNVDGG